MFSSGDEPRASDLHKLVVPRTPGEIITAIVENERRVEEASGQNEQIEFVEKPNAD